jgi:hypothetical protein
MEGTIMFSTIQDYLAHLHAQHVRVDHIEVERRLCRCRSCGPSEACPRIRFEQWLPLLATGGREQAAELCGEWK